MRDYTGRLSAGRPVAGHPRTETRTDRADEVVPMAEDMLRIAFTTLRPAARLPGQRLLGAKTFKE